MQSRKPLKFDPQKEDAARQHLRERIAARRKARARRSVFVDLEKEKDSGDMESTSRKVCSGVRRMVDGRFHVGYFRSE